MGNKLRFSLGKMYLDKEDKKVKGLSDKAIWACNDTIALFIKACLEKLNALRHGYPIRYSEKEWEDVLNSLANDFNLISSDWYDLIENDKIDDAVKNQLPAKIQPLLGRNCGQLTEKEYAIINETRREFVHQTFNKLAEIFDMLWD